jgi:anti-sigma B factor antagonist
MTLEESVHVADQEIPAQLARDASAGNLFQMSVSQMEDRCLIVLSGELDISTAPVLRHRLAEITPDLTTDLVLDIGLLTFIDSTGLSLMVSEHKKLQAQGAGLTIFSPTPMTRRLFEISGLNSVLSILPESEAP